MIIFKFSQLNRPHTVLCFKDSSAGPAPKRSFASTHFRGNSPRTYLCYSCVAVYLSQRNILKQNFAKLLQCKQILEMQFCPGFNFQIYINQRRWEGMGARDLAFPARRILSLLMQLKNVLFLKTTFQKCCFENQHFSIMTVFFSAAPNAIFLTLALQFLLSLVLLFYESRMKHQGDDQIFFDQFQDACSDMR